MKTKSRKLTSHDHQSHQRKLLSFTFFLFCFLESSPTPRHTPAYTLTHTPPYHHQNQNNNWAHLQSTAQLPVKGQRTSKVLEMRTLSCSGRSWLIICGRQSSALLWGSSSLYYTEKRAAAQSTRSAGSQRDLEHQRSKKIDRRQESPV